MSIEEAKADFWEGAEYIGDRLLHDLGKSAEAIAGFTHQELLSIAFKLLWPEINGHTEFLLKITTHPHIMIPYKKFKRYFNPIPINRRLDVPPIVSQKWK